MLWMLVGKDLNSCKHLKHIRFNLQHKNRAKEYFKLQHVLCDFWTARYPPVCYSRLDYTVVGPGDKLKS